MPLFMLSLVCLLAVTVTATFEECSAALVATTDVANTLTTFGTAHSTTARIGCGSAQVLFRTSLSDVTATGVTCARRCVVLSTSGQTFYWRLAFSNTSGQAASCLCLEATVNTTDDDCADPIYRTHFSACSPRPAEGVCGVGCENRNGCCEVSDKVESSSPQMLLTVLTIVGIIVVIIAAAALVLLRMARRRRARMDGEAGRERRYRRGELRDGSEAAAMADTIVRAYQSKDAHRQWEVQSSSTIATQADESCACCTRPDHAPPDCVLRCGHHMHAHCLRDRVKRQLTTYEALTCPLCGERLLESPTAAREEDAPIRQPRSERPCRPHEALPCCDMGDSWSVELLPPSEDLSL